MMKRIACAALLLVVIGCHRPQVPVGDFLVRVDGPWVTPREAAGKNIKTAPGTLIVFRNDNEFFELHCRLIEQADGTWYVSSNHPRASALGQWTKSWSKVHVVRQKISRADAAAILCKPITFDLTGNVVTGNAGGKDDGVYSSQGRLVAPDYPYYIKEARESPVTCPKE